ncbi:radical SAM protein [Endomicrobium proavitum]|uniref:Radical SAM domain protein n=1 Tax=Endomicrobium proavitum TaxID=1408281 RepID=A0A0G3WGP8_9BACT|nr:radical SAM protein [Endomicrobium proavitum]AKL97493.1 Radical SAM domain protein [Endomicrobium proavitum]
MNFEKNIETLFSMQDACVICPKKCKAKRNAGQKGLCKTADKIFIASANVHTGEEPPISGSRGSGTIFFSNCTLSCVFCQNYPISSLGNGNEFSLEELVDKMLLLQDKGVHNINFVTPTHYSAHVAKAVYLAKKKGLTIPILSNNSGYESVETLKLLEGLIDIYLPDIKYADNEIALKYSGVKDYVEVNRAALKEMQRQVGNLEFDENGIAKSGLLIRHMVMPENLENTRASLEFISLRLSPQTYVSLMAQYHPANKSYNFKELSRGLTKEEYDKAAEYLKLYGLENGWMQELEN